MIWIDATKEDPKEPGTYLLWVGGADGFIVSDKPKDGPMYFPKTATHWLFLNPPVKTPDQKALEYITTLRKRLDVIGDETPRMCDYMRGVVRELKKNIKMAEDMLK